MCRVLLQPYSPSEKAPGSGTPLCSARILLPPLPPRQMPLDSGVPRAHKKEQDCQVHSQKSLSFSQYRNPHKFPLRPSPSQRRSPFLKHPKVVIKCNHFPIPPTNSSKGEIRLMSEFTSVLGKVKVSYNLFPFHLFIPVYFCGHFESIFPSPRLLNTR